MQDWLCMSEAQTAEVLVALTKLALFKTATLDTVSYENEHFFVVYPNQLQTILSILILKIV
jgi:hypothetical protein